MYEWENEINENSIHSEIHRLKLEIKRVCETTLRGTFRNEEDKQYWVGKLKTMNSKLSSLEKSIKNDDNQ